VLDRDVFDRVSESAVSVRERLGLAPLTMRWRADIDMTRHYAGRRHRAFIIRTAELVPWERELARRGLVQAPREAWPPYPIMQPVTEDPVYSFISCTLRQAADRTGVSETTLQNAIADGFLKAHRAGDKGGRIVLRAKDLDDWVQSLPTESPREREWSRSR
jgi:excisionase family DNA binding protein